MSKKTLAILHYENLRSSPRDYLVFLMRTFWERDGWKVIDLFGIKKFVQADVLLVHVDLSQVPPSYTEFAKQYPRSMNAQATDIRKSTYSPHLLGKEDVYDYPVIVKSNLNYAGEPERLIRKFGYVRSVAGKCLRRWRSKRSRVIREKSDYKIFETLREVPHIYFQNDFIIQKFLPETRDGEYILREYYFLDTAEYQNVEVSPDPIFTTGSRQIYAACEPAHVELQRLRKQLHLDFGKIDFALVDGKPVIFDANKTVGIRRTPTVATWEIARRLAAGLSCDDQRHCS